MNSPRTRALILAGGWDGHRPQEVAARISQDLTAFGITCQISETLEVLDHPEQLANYDLIIPCWTMGELSDAQWNHLDQAVRAGVGIAGIHGGMGDAFRSRLEYQWMVGGQFVGHPHVGNYSVHVHDRCAEITAGISNTFFYQSEQYYMLIDPSVQILASAAYDYDGRVVEMPVAWIKMWGKGRVFYSALGHDPAEFDQFPDAWRMALQGMSWAAKKSANS